MHEGIWVHGAPARSLEQINDFLTGDAHDQSKVEWYDGEVFWNLLDLVRDAQDKRERKRAALLELTRYSQQNGDYT